MTETPDEALDQVLAWFAVAAEEGLFDPDEVVAANARPGASLSARAHAAATAAAWLGRGGPQAVRERVSRRARLHFDAESEAAAWLERVLDAMRRRAAGPAPPRRDPVRGGSGG
jgi:hypothetical protein